MLTILRNYNTPFIFTKADRTRHQMFLLFLKHFLQVAVFASAMGQTSVDAARYFVSSSQGNDLYPPRRAHSPQTPWRTIQRALDHAKAGDTIVVLPGMYREHARFKSSGTAELPITLTSRHYGEAKVRGSISGIGVAHIKVSGLDVANSVLDPDHPPTSFDPKGIYFYYAHHIEISTNIVHDCRGGGIGLVNTDEVSVCDNIVFRNAAGFDGNHSGISVYQPLNYTGEHDDSPGTRICRNLCYSNSNSQYFNDEGEPREITDGHGIIIDDTLATQREAFEADLDYFWTVAPEAPLMPIDYLSPYTRTTLVDSNICHSNGASGVSLFICENVIVRNNTCLLNQRNVFDTAEINLGGTSQALVQNNLMISPMRQAGGDGRQGRDMRQAAKLSDNIVVNDRDTIRWTANALYDSTTVRRGLSDLHDASSIALSRPVPLLVNPMTGAVNVNLNNQTRDRGAIVEEPQLGDFRSSPRVQGSAIDIGALEVIDPPLEFPTPEDEALYQSQLERQRLRESQLPRLNCR